MASKQPTPAHPYAELFPIDDGPTLRELAKDIKEHGQLEKCIKYNGKLLDGRRRELACFIERIEPEYKEFRGSDAEALAFVVSKNLHRRNLTVNDRAFIAAKIASMQVGDNQHVNEGGHACPPSEHLSNEKAAELAGVSRRTVVNAKKIEREGTQELKDAAHKGTISVKDAATVASEPPDVQRKAVEAVVNGKAKTATQAVKEIEEANPETEEPWVDAWGIPITREAESAFRNCDKFDELIKALKHAQDKFKELASLPGGEYLTGCNVDNTTSGYTHQGIKTCIMNVKDAKPKYTVCPYAYNPHKKHQKDCSLCKGRGWLGSISKSTGPSEELIEAAKKAHGVA